MCASPQSNWLNIIAVRGDFLGENQEKPRGGGVDLSPLGKTKTETTSSF